MPLMSIDYLGGIAPVQAFGTVSGHPFYFRARGDSWVFAVSTYHTAPDPLSALVGKQQGFVLSKPYGRVGDMAASAMSEDVAQGILRRCARAFAAFVGSEGVR